MDENMQYSLLIVDDRASNILALANILKPEYTVYASRNGRDALRVAVEKQPDVILLDVVMPDMNGYEVIAALKRDESTRAIPVIFITSLNSAAPGRRLYQQAVQSGHRQAAGAQPDSDRRATADDREVEHDRPAYRHSQPPQLRYEAAP